MKLEYIVQIPSRNLLSGRDASLPGTAMCATHHIDESGLLPCVVGALLATSILVACVASHLEASTHSQRSTASDCQCQCRARNSNARWTDLRESGQLASYHGALLVFGMSVRADMSRVLPSIGSCWCSAGDRSGIQVGASIVCVCNPLHDLWTACQINIAFSLA